MIPYQMNIPFNIPTQRKELNHLRKVIKNQHFAGAGPFTDQCTRFLIRHFGFGNLLLTSSCTDALEMSAILAA